MMDSFVYFLSFVSITHRCKRCNVRDWDGLCVHKISILEEIINLGAFLL